MKEGTENPNAEEDQQESSPHWLRQVQNLSWEPELITSGGSVVTLYFIIDRIWYLDHYLLQQFEVYPLFANLVAIVVFLVLGLLFFTFILHIVFRIAWIAFVGISFVFPQGVNKEMVRKKFGKPATDPEVNPLSISHPNKIVLALENISSTLFSVPVFAFGIIFSSGVLFFLPSALFWYFFAWNGVLVYFGIFLISMVITYSKKTREKNWVKKYNRFVEKYTLAFVSNNIIYLYQNNSKSGLKFLIFFLIFSLISGIVLGDMTENKAEAYMAHLFVPPEKDEKDEKPYARFQNNEYETHRDKGTYVLRASIPTMKTSEGHLELFISLFAYDLRVRDAIKAKKDSGEAFSFDDMFTVYLDGQQVEGIEWGLREHPQTGQQGVTAMVPIKEKEFGRHELRIDKKSWHYRKDSLIDYEGWERIPFWKES